jgi:hypothetical protein
MPTLVSRFTRCPRSPTQPRYQNLLSAFALRGRGASAVEEPPGPTCRQPRPAAAAPPPKLRPPRPHRAARRPPRPAQHCPAARAATLRGWAHRRQRLWPQAAAREAAAAERRRHQLQESAPAVALPTLRRRWPLSPPRRAQQGPPRQWPLRWCQPPLPEPQTRATAGPAPKAGREGPGRSAETRPPWLPP